jgi:hypothetical protein
MRKARSESYRRSDLPSYLDGKGLSRLSIGARSGSPRGLDHASSRVENFQNRAAHEAGMGMERKLVRSHAGSLTSLMVHYRVIWENRFAARKRQEMSAIRRTHEPAFKAEVARAAPRGDATVVPRLRPRRRMERLQASTWCRPAN